MAAVVTCERMPSAVGLGRELSSRRLALAGASIGGVIAVALPLPGLLAIRASQDSFNDGNLSQAIDDAQKAEDWQPWAAAPMIQKALVLQQDGQLQAAQAAAVAATNREPANWRNWYVLAGLDSHLGLTDQAAQATETARSLNPRSPLFASSATSEPQ
jgi:tetratricopeptide (TPR) repeat protein